MAYNSPKSEGGWTMSLNLNGSAYWPALLLLAVSLGFSLTARLIPREGQPVAVVFSPGLSYADRLSRALGAGGDGWLGSGPGQWTVIVRSDRPDFADRLYRAGAWLVLRAPSAGLCQ